MTIDTFIKAKGLQENGSKFSLALSILRSKNCVITIENSDLDVTFNSAELNLTIQGFFERELKYIKEEFNKI